MHTPHCTTVFSEADCFEVLRVGRSMPGTACKIVVHPRWGTAVYPASIFSTAPPAAVAEAVLSAAAREAIAGRV
jgi:hypothetical protein